MRRHLCPDCLSAYKRSRDGRAARKCGGAWGHNKWPAFIFHEEETRKCARHHAQSCADGAARRAGINKATPAWADRAAIRAIFERARQVSNETGVPHEVDHVVPLNGRTVSGLHVHWNLMVIPAAANRAKSNRFGDG